MSDEEFIEAIKAGGKRMDNAMLRLYKEQSLRIDIVGLLRKWGASEHQVEDLFQDGICALIINIRTNKFRGDASVKTYLSTICRNIFFKSIKKEVRHNELKGNISDNETDQHTPELEILDKERQYVLDLILEKMGKTCKEVLKLWAMRYSMQEIASHMEYKSAGMARKKKHDCLKRLIAFSRENMNLIKGI